jgi:hypothetical protein
MPWRDLRARLERVEIRMMPAAGIRERREVGAFVRYCVRRIERDLGTIERWTVTVVPTRTGEFSSHASARIGGFTIEASGDGRDHTLAVWDALVRLEQVLREQAATRH